MFWVASASAVSTYNPEVVRLLVVRIYIGSKRMHTFLKVSTFCALAFFLGLAHAGWENFFNSNSAGQWFIDESTLQANKDSTKVWTMTNFGAPVQGSINSARRLYELDCTSARARVLQASAWAGKNATGTQVSTIQNPQPWFYVEPGTALDGLIKVFCKH